MLVAVFAAGHIQDRHLQMSWLTDWDMAADNDGNDGFYIAWHDDRDNNMLSSSWVHHISNTGAALFPTNGVEASAMAGRNHFDPCLALPPGSTNVYVFWNEMSANQNQRGIYGQKLTSAPMTRRKGPSPEMSSWKTMPGT